MVVTMWNGSILSRKLPPSNGVIMLTLSVVVSIELNKRHYFWANLYLTFHVPFLEEIEGVQPYKTSGFEQERYDFVEFLKDFAQISIQKVGLLISLWLFLFNPQVVRSVTNRIYLRGVKEVRKTKS
jgi:hypothetical protein